MIPQNEDRGRSSKRAVGGGQGGWKPNVEFGRGRILVVEDEEIIRDAMGPLLSSRGHTVEFAANGLEALRRLSVASPPDVIVLDLRMPVMNGWEFRAIQKEDPRLSLIPVVAVSADGSAQAAAISAEAYLRKPLDPEGFLAAIDRVLIEQERARSAHADETERLDSLKRLAATVAHEVNNPLTIVMLNLTQSLEDLQRPIQTLEKPMSMSPSAVTQGEIKAQLVSVTGLLEECQVGAERIRNVIGNLQCLSYENPEPPMSLDVVRLIDEAAREVWNPLSDRPRLVKDFGAVPPIRGEERTLRRVFRSLLVLAAQSGPKTQLEQSEIRISTRVSVGNDGDEIRVEIGNSRLGRARASDSQVFEPLVSVGSLGATGGLEILISQQTLRRHGGRLVIESGPTAGTIFHVFLPAPSLASQPALAAPGPPPAFVVAARKVAPERRSVLVIDDQLLIRRQIQRALAREHDVILVASAELALIRLELGEVFDVVLCDLEMPEMNGASFHTEIQERWPDLLPRLVFMTGGPMSSASSHFLRTAAIRVLAKPFSLPRLRQFVRDASMRM